MSINLETRYFTVTKSLLKGPEITESGSEIIQNINSAITFFLIHDGPWVIGMELKGKDDDVISFLEEDDLWQHVSPSQEGYPSIASDRQRLVGMMKQAKARGCNAVVFKQAR